MLNVAVICVPTTVVLFTVIPAPLTSMVAPVTRFVPVKVTGTLCPCTPLFGLIEVNVGGAGRTWSRAHPNKIMLSAHAIPRVRAHNLFTLYFVNWALSSSWHGVSFQRVCAANTFVWLWGKSGVGSLVHDRYQAKICEAMESEFR